jgi:hypothetical protein
MNLLTRHHFSNELDTFLTLIIGLRQPLAQSCNNVSPVLDLGLVGFAALAEAGDFFVCPPSIFIAKEYNELSKRKCLTLINPTWVKLSTKTAWDEEGCLSVPGIYGQVKRYTKIKVKAFDEHGKPLEFIAEDFFARIVQHEADHLNGTLFIEKAKDLHKIDKNQIGI